MDFQDHVKIYKTLWSSSKKYPIRRKDGRKDGQTLFCWRLPAIASDPKRVKNFSNKKKSQDLVFPRKTV